MAIGALETGVIDLGSIFSGREGREKRRVVACELLQGHVGTHFVRVDVQGDH